VRICHGLIMKLELDQVGMSEESLSFDTSLWFRSGSVVDVEIASQQWERLNSRDLMADISISTLERTFTYAVFDVYVATACMSEKTQKYLHSSTSE